MQYCKDEALVGPVKKYSTFCILEPSEKVKITKPYRGEPDTWWQS